MSRPDKSALYSPDFQEQLAGHRAESCCWRCGNGSPRRPWPARQDAGLDVESYLPYDLLVKMDIATMANSLEARSPFLDHHVMEFCARLPASYKLRGCASSTC